MIPPGIPDFLTRERHVAAGEHVLSGRAWSGSAPISAVEVSADAGATWASADLGPSAGPGVWRAWTHRWRATRGTHELCCRATDGAGQGQSLGQRWNVGGYANNAVQRITVHVA